MATMEIMSGLEWEVMTTEITDAQLDDAQPSDLKRMLDVAEVERMCAMNKGYFEIARDVSAMEKLIKAQQRINDNRASLKHGCICG